MKERGRESARWRVGERKRDGEREIDLGREKKEGGMKGGRERDGGGIRHLQEWNAGVKWRMKSCFRCFLSLRSVNRMDGQTDTEAVWRIGVHLCPQMFKGFDLPHQLTFNIECFPLETQQCWAMKLQTGSVGCLDHAAGARVSNRWASRDRTGVPLLLCYRRCC